MLVLHIFFHGVTAAPVFSTFIRPSVFMAITFRTWNHAAWLLGYLIR
jgi:hypothetical protein